jgi:beta-lactamase class A
MMALAAAWSMATQQSPRPASLAAARRTMDRLASSINGRVGAAAMIVESGEIVFTHGDERFPMQSVYKVPIAMAVLRRIDAGSVRLGQVTHVRRIDLVPDVHSQIRELNPNGTSLTVRELLRAAIVESDGTASDLLLVLAPPADVTAMVRKLGIAGMVIAATERETAKNEMAQYKNWSTPRAAVQLLRALQVGRDLSAPSRVLLTGWMTETPIGDKRIKALLPPGTTVAHKTGLARTRRGLTRATNDIGIVTLPNGKHLAIAVFIKDSRATEAQREMVIAKIARAAWDAATGRVPGK